MSAIEQQHQTFQVYINPTSTIFKELGRGVIIPAFVLSDGRFNQISSIKQVIATNTGLNEIGSELNAL